MQDQNVTTNYPVLIEFLKEKLLYLRYENLNKTYIMQGIMKKQQNIIIQKQNHNQKTESLQVHK